MSTKTTGTKSAFFKWVRRCLRIFLILFLLMNIMSAFHAWKLTHNYAGVTGHTKSPKKMSFFEKTGAAFFGVKNGKPIIKEFPQRDYQNVTLKTKNDLKIEAWYIKKDSAVGTVILFHGHMGTKGSVLTAAAEFFNLGYNVMPVDFRAHGNSEGVACSIGKKEGEEVKLAYDYVKTLGEKNIILWGTSMGAAAITSSFNLYEDLKPSKIILEMPFGSLREAVRGRVKQMGIPAEPVASLFTFWGAVEQGFWTFNYEPDEYVKKITCPVLLQWGANDMRVSKNETDAVYKNIAAVNKKLVVYENAGHESLIKNDSILWRKEVGIFLEIIPN
jgi:uncharacterized protein